MTVNITVVDVFSQRSTLNRREHDEIRQLEALGYTVAFNLGA